MDTKDFIAILAPFAVADQKRSKVLSSITVAQGILESDSGKSAPGNNLFGVKGKGEMHATKEFVNGKEIQIIDGFRVYDSWAGSVHDHSDFLIENGRYARAGFFECCDKLDYVGAARSLQVAGYATDPNYASKLLKLIVEYNLEQFDKEGISMSYSPNVTKERIYAASGVLKRCDGDYSKLASDVRYLKLMSGQVSFKFVARKGAKVSDLVKEFGADFGTNAPFFFDGQVLGDAIADGQVISTGYGKMLTWDEFGFKAGKAEIGQLDKNAGYDVLLQGAPLLINNGNLVWDYYRVQQQVPDDIGKSNAQRTFYGIDANGDIHIAVADGRTKYDKGPSLEEMALYMQSKGCVAAINFDGGSSSVLADKTGSLGQNKGTDERAVNHALLIFIKADPSPDVSPATPAAVDYLTTGADFLKSEGYTTQDHDPKEPVTIGLLGSLLKNKKEKGV